MELISLCDAGGALRAEVAELAGLGARKIARLDAAFRRRLVERGFDVAAAKALAAIAPPAAVRRTLEEFFEQVAYSGRRLAKLNVPPEDAARALEAYGLPPGRLHLATLMALNDAYYQVREGETQAFYGLFRAEAEARDVEDLLRRAVAVLTRALGACAGRLAPAALVDPALLRRLGRPRYIERRGAELLLDPALRGRYASYWSVPFKTGARVEAVAQFAFAKPYPWLPRELQLLEAAGERCLAAMERRRLLADLAAREAEVRALAADLIGVEERERRRIGRELHDEAGQSLMLLRLELEKLERAVSDAGHARRLEEAREIVEGTIAEIRRTIAALGPAVLDQLGLPAALRQLAARLEKAAGVRARVRVSLPEARLGSQVETVMYRLAQECSSNIARHARARRVNICLQATDRWVELRVTDDGLGFNVEAALRKRESYGLAGMHERVALLRGTLKVESRPGRGAMVCARLPLS